MNSRRRNHYLVTCTGLFVACWAASAMGQTLELVNNHPFSIRMPWTLRDPGLQAGADALTRSGLAQKTQDGVVIMVDLPASGSRALDLSQPAAARPGPALLSVDAGDRALHLSYRQKDLGRLSFGLVVRPAVKPARGREDEAGAGRPELHFEPLPLAFHQTQTGPLFTTYVAETAAAGLRLAVALDGYREGFLDLRSTVINEGGPQKNVYAAVIMRWEAKAPSRTIGYDNHVLTLGENAATPWRKGEGRQLFVQRGVDWIAGTSEAGASAVLLNDFAPSFTYHKEATAKAPPQLIGANSAQLAQEACTEGGALYCVTELAHPNIRTYRSRVQDNVLPDKSQPLNFKQRLIFSSEPVTPESADNMFAAYAGLSLSEIRNPKSEISVSFGVPFTKFGTAYFPYSTLGENFITRRLPRMNQDTYWPLAADVVNNYPLFADDIHRDLRILKAMGFESDRLHHLEMLYARDGGGKEYCTAAQREAFLDFYFAELKKLGLTALLDVKLPAPEIARLVKRYRRLIDGVEIDNEVLIFGIRDDEVQSWKDLYAAVKKVAPEIPVHLTAHTNTGAFARLNALGVPYDRLGEHAYQDSLDALPSGRGYALQVASFATKMNRPPVITEWNWRGLTRMTEEARAAVYAPVFENVLKTRCMPEMYQFQFNDSLAMSPEGLKGIRHYELLNLSRRPKAEADVLGRLIETYSAPDSGPRMLPVERPVVEFKNGAAAGQIHLHNTSKETLHIRPTLEPDAGVDGKLAFGEVVTLAPNESARISFQLQLKAGALPGFYHCFVRLEDEGHHLLRYGWIEARNPGAPKFDAESKSDVAYNQDASSFDLNRPVAVVYGDDCPILELEAAWVLYQTLESATGRRVSIYTLSDVPKDGKQALVYLGTPRSLPAAMTTDPSGDRFVARISQNGADSLLIGGSDSRNAALAGMDFTLRYWRFAKDAACRRIPLAGNTVLRGPDAGQLP